MEFKPFKTVLNQQLTKLKHDWDNYEIQINDQPHVKYLSGETGYQSMLGQNSYQHTISQPSLQERRNYNQEEQLAHDLCGIFKDVQAYLEQNNIKALKHSNMDEHTDMIRLIRNVRLHSNGKLTFKFNFKEQKQRKIINYTLESIELAFQNYIWDKKSRNGSYIFKRENNIIENILTQTDPKLDDKIFFDISDISKTKTDI